MIFSEMFSSFADRCTVDCAQTVALSCRIIATTGASGHILIDENPRSSRRASNNRLASVLDQSHANMVAAGADLSLTARADDVSAAILIGAKKRSSALNPLFFAGLGGIQ